LMYTFMNVLALAIQLFALTVGVHLFRLGQRVLLGLLAVVLALGLLFVGDLGSLQDWLRALLAVEQSAAWQIASRPLAWFIEAFLAEKLWPDLVRYAGLALLVDLVVAAFVFLLDAQYLEAAAHTSART